MSPKKVVQKVEAAVSAGKSENKEGTGCEDNEKFLLNTTVAVEVGRGGLTLTIGRENNTKKLSDT